jgi:hypothetical protein
MLNSKYTAFQIKNTSDVPLEISLKDPAGNSFTAALDPGEESIQVAPAGTIWGIKFVASEGGRAGITGDRPGITGGRPGITGDRPGITGDRPGITGERPGITGDRPGITGDRPGITGDRPGITGDRGGIVGEG